jgi:hypothetical protein
MQFKMLPKKKLLPVLKAAAKMDLSLISSTPVSANYPAL